MQRQLTPLIIILCLTICLSCKHKTEQIKMPVDTLSAKELEDPRIKSLTVKIQADPNNGENYFLRAVAFLENNNPQASFKDASMAIALDSANLKYYFFMADLALKNGSADAAIQTFTQIIHRSPDNEEARIKLSKVYFYQRDYTNSLIQLANLEELNKTNPEIFFIRGLNLKEMGDTTRAMASFQKAVTLKPDFYDAYIQLGLLTSKKPSQLSAKYYDNAIRIDSSNTEGYYNKAKFFQDRGDAAFQKKDVKTAEENYELAKSVYHELIEKKPQYENAFFNLGFIYTRQDSLDKAYRMFDFAIKMKPSYAEAYYYRGLISLARGKNDVAEADFRQALSLKPDYDLAKKELDAMKK